MADQTQNQGSTPPPEPSPTPPPEPSPAPPIYHDWREERRAERMARREARRQRHTGRPYGWFGGAVLILIGIFFLLQNFGFQIFVNWWAILILVPAFWAFIAAWNVYQDNGRITAGVAGSAAVGILLTVLALVFLLNLAAGIFWPILLIAGGLVLLVSAFSPR